MKLLSFAVWGDNPKYLLGATRNAILAKDIYPGWKCRFYVSNDVPSIILMNLSIYKNVDIVKMGPKGDWTGMYWRFLPTSETDVDVLISRDTDSRLNLREKLAVDQWLESDYGFHIMRDHPAHGFPVLGGMWGAKKGCLPDMKQMIESLSHTMRQN